MKTDDIEARMRALEYFHSLRALPGAWLVVRVDGRSFTRLTKDRFEKPFDRGFHEAMMETGEALLEGLSGVYAYTESDEISVLLPRETSLFDREVEKLVSVSSGIASAQFSHVLGSPAHFDGRLWMAPAVSDVIDYFRWRQADAARCALNGWCYWSLIKAGATAAQATQELNGKTLGEKNELLFQHGVNFNEVPMWQRRGTGIRWETFEKPGLNPKTGEQTVATRRHIVRNQELPMNDGYREYLEETLAGDDAWSRRRPDPERPS